MRVEVMLRSRRPITGISRFRRAKLWVDREAFDRARTLLRRARHTVLIQMFIWKDDVLGRSMAELLVEIADRGVRVEIHKEAVGDMFEFHRDFLGTQNHRDGVWRRFWNHPRIQILHETRDDHAKVFIIDDRILLLTGMNIADEYHEQWHDYMVELRGRPFVEQYLSDGDLPTPPEEARLVMNTGRRKDIRTTVMALLAGARRSIVVEHCYLSDHAVLRLLARRSREGIDVVIIFPGQADVHHYSNMQSVSQLLAEADLQRMSLFRYPGMFHGKILLIDRERAFVGSANLVTSSLDHMGEVNVLLEGRSHPAVRKLRGILRQDIARSTAISRSPRWRWLWKWLTWLQL